MAWQKALVTCVAAMTLASGAKAEDTFNLVCDGQTQIVVPAILKDETKPYHKVYRVDLGKKTWCEADCPTIFNFADVSPTQLVFFDETIDAPSTYSKTREAVSRTDGTHSIFAQSGVGINGVTMSSKGQCEKAPFTGFPTPETKF